MWVASLVGRAEKLWNGHHPWTPRWARQRLMLTLVLQQTSMMFGRMWMSSRANCTRCFGRPRRASLSMWWRTWTPASDWRLGDACAKGSIPARDQGSGSCFTPWRTQRGRRMRPCKQPSKGGRRFEPGTTRRRTSSVTGRAFLTPWAWTPWSAWCRRTWRPTCSWTTRGSRTQMRWRPRLWTTWRPRPDRGCSCRRTSQSQLQVAMVQSRWTWMDWCGWLVEAWIPWCMLGMEKGKEKVSQVEPTRWLGSLMASATSAASMGTRRRIVGANQEERPVRLRLVEVQRRATRLSSRAPATSARRKVTRRQIAGWRVARARAKARTQIRLTRAEAVPTQWSKQSLNPLQMLADWIYARSSWSPLQTAQSEVLEVQAVQVVPVDQQEMQDLGPRLWEERQEDQGTQQAAVEIDRLQGQQMSPMKNKRKSRGHHQERQLRSTQWKVKGGFDATWTLEPQWLSFRSICLSAESLLRWGWRQLQVRSSGAMVQDPSGGKIPVELTAGWKARWPTSTRSWWVPRKCITKDSALGWDLEEEKQSHCLIQCVGPWETPMSRRLQDMEKGAFCRSMRRMASTTSTWRRIQREKQWRDHQHRRGDLHLGEEEEHRDLRGLEMIQEKDRGVEDQYAPLKRKRRRRQLKMKVNLEISLF